MSIFTKVLILFIISFSLMLFVSKKTEKLTQESIQSLLKEKYLQVSDELFKYLANNDMDALNKKFQALQFERVANTEETIATSKVLYDYETDLSRIQILKEEDDRLLLYMRYLDDDILLIDLSQNKNFEEIAFLNYLILADILILIILFLLILKMIYPLKNISKNIQAFGEGDYSARVEVISNDEIAGVSNTFNAMASNIQNLISARQRLLRDIGHELKTPISKSILSLEMMEESKYKAILQRALVQMDEMTNDLLNLEKLNNEHTALKVENFTVETLISTALSKLFIEDETLIEIKIESNFEIEADLDYLSMALKNLIDNALKYTTVKPIFILVVNQYIKVKSKGPKLEKPLAFYCEVFTQGDNSREEKGYGLGLSMVNRILERHGFKLLYTYEEGMNVFTMKVE